MLNILIIDDNPIKTGQIRNIIGQYKDILVENVTTATDSVTGRKHLCERHYDLLILDMNLPERFGEEPKANGGIDILREIKSCLRMKNPTHIIGVTAFENIAAIIQSEFSDQLVQLIISNESTNWNQQLTNKIGLILNAKIDTGKSPDIYDYDIAIITALPDPELTSILNLDLQWSDLSLENDSTYYHTAVATNDSKNLKIVAATANQMGMTSTAVLSSKMIFNFRPKYLIMAGIAAGVKGVVNVGDILITDSTWDYGSGKISNHDNRSIFSPDPRTLAVDSDIKEKLIHAQICNKYVDDIRSNWRGDKPSYATKIHIGPVVSGASVIQDSTIVQSVMLQSRKVIGIEMETYATFYAAYNGMKPKPKPLSIKAVCDHADETKNNDYQKYAAYMSAEFVFRFALEYLD